MTGGRGRRNTEQEEFYQLINCTKWPTGDDVEQKCGWGGTPFWLFKIFYLQLEGLAKSKFYCHVLICVHST